MYENGNAAYGGAAGHMRNFGGTAAEGHQTEGIPQGSHGKLSTYTTGGCRCDLCRGAQRAYYLVRKARAKAKAS
jgi:hypothetical protein